MVEYLPLILNGLDEVDENTFKEKKKEHGDDKVFKEDKSTLQTKLKEKEKTHSMPVTKCRDQGQHINSKSGTAEGSNYCFSGLFINT